jgi:hypothetical protein
MKKTSQSNRSNQDNFQSSMNQGNTKLMQGMNGRDSLLNNQSNNSTLKGKLQNLEEEINSVASDMNNHKKELVFLKTGKENLKDELKARKVQVKSELANELNKVEEQMKTHFSHQKAENSKLQQQITQLKNDKTSLQTLLNSILY